MALYKGQDMEHPIIIKNAFNKKWVELIKENVELLKRTKPDRLKQDDKLFYRLSVYEDPLFELLHHKFAKKICDWAGVNLKPSYCFASFYTSQGICPPHVDRPQCVMTFDYCINQQKPWPIFINSKDKFGTVSEEVLKENAKEYILDENDAIIFSGTNHWHYRNKIPENSTSDWLFFHFVNEEYKGPLK